MYRKKGSPYWWIAYRDAGGRKVEQSTQTPDRAKAALIEAERRAAVWNETQRGIAPPFNPLFDEVLADYLEDARRRRDITSDLSLTRTLAAAFAGMPIRTITAAHVRDYIRARRQTGVADSSIRRALAVFRAAVNQVRRERGADLPNPAVGQRLPTPPGRVRWLTPEAADVLLAAAATSQTECLHDFIVLALHTGMRKGELLGLEWARVDLRHDLLYLDTQKNGQRGSVPLNAIARQAFLRRARFRAEHCPAAPRVFCDAAGAPFRDLWRGFKAACRRAGIADFRPHDLRHTTAAWLVQAGVPLLEVADLLRHSSVVMTQRYAHLAPTSARNAVARLAGGNLATALEETRAKTAR